MSSGNCDTTCVTAGSLLSRARAVLNDGRRQCEGTQIAFAHWDNTTLLDFLNEGLSLLVSMRPDAFTETAVIALVAGSKQKLPPEYDALVQVVSNADASEAIGAPVSEADDDYTRIAPSKCDDTTCGGGDGTEYQVVSYSRFAQSQTEFSVQPPVPAGAEAKVCVRAVRAPSPICEDATCIPVAAKFQAALVNWVLHRAFAKDIESAFATGMSDRYYLRFFEMLETQRIAESRFRSGYYLGMLGTEDSQARTR